MKILIFTQKVDSTDPILGFFHRWLEEFAKNYEKVTVVCLYKGTYNLPANVKVLSLGKEEGVSRTKYITRFYHYIATEKNEYDKVFVHMNQEYALLGGIFWKLFSKPMYLWRNHPRGSMTTRIVVMFSHKVFCTSKDSFTAQFKKTQLMPIGIDTSFFKRDSTIQRNWNQVLYLGRISRIKNVDIIVKAFAEVVKSNPTAHLLVVGDVVSSDTRYLDEIKNMAIELSLGDRIQFQPAVSNAETVKYYNESGISINATESGSFDKTIGEAMACGQIVLTSNSGVTGQIDTRCIFKEKDISDLAQKLDAILALDNSQKEAIANSLQEYVKENHSLTKLLEKISCQ